MIEAISSAFGYVLNFIYELVKNYGLAIILFSILLKLIMLPLSYKQQKTMKKSMKIQEKTKEIQEKYKNNKEKMNQEIMDLYKRENMSPFSGCLSTIIQMVLLFSIFFLVRSPLTHMKHLNTYYVDKNETIENVQQLDIDQSIKENDENAISLIEYYEGKIKKDDEKKSSAYQEIEIIKQFSQDDEKIKINMDFLGIDLSNVPTQDMSNPTVFIIPALYVISSFASIWITDIATKKKKKQEEKPQENQDPMAGMSKSMLWFMPIMSISIAIIAPLGLALYWLINNILMIIERLIMNKIIKDDDEKEDNKSEKNPIEGKKIESKEEPIKEDNKKNDNKDSNET